MLALLTVVFLAVDLGSTKTTAASAYGYDAPAVARVDAQAFGGAKASSTQLGDTQEGSDSRSVEDRRTTTTPRSRSVATEAEVLTGSGPVPGVLEASPRAQSVGAINSWNGKPVEFGVDPESGTFAMGRPAASAGLKGSPHQQLVAAIDGNSSTVVGGIVKRGENGLLTF